MAGPIHQYRAIQYHAAERSVRQYLHQRPLGIAIPAASANAKMDTLLVNNVLTTNISKDLKTTFRYRYYDLDNRTPELLWQNYVFADGAISSGPRTSRSPTTSKTPTLKPTTARPTR